MSTSSDMHTPSSQNTIRNGLCTHITMTRLYTQEFHCKFCYSTGSFGWLYRCTQDRDLIVEHMLENGQEDFFDTLPTIFPLSSEPKKRSPAARASKLSFLDEIEDKMDTYTTSQLTQILKQRAHLLDTVMDAEKSTKAEEKCYLPSPSENFPAVTSWLNQLSSPPKPSTPSRKPGVPQEHLECQFKCCAKCRPTNRDRAFLSLNGIMQGDIPASAIVGFGFHLQGKRPVADARLVANIGLGITSPRKARPSPHRLHTTFQSSTPRPTSLSPSGLVITTTNESSPPGFRIPTFAELHPNRDTSPPSHRRHRQPSPGTVWYEVACLTALPPQTAEEIALIEMGNDSPLTGMEKEEFDDGMFGSMPLSVDDGIAVTEEAVGLHVPDVITQF